MALSDKQKHHIEAWQASGLTKSAYCRQTGLNVKTFTRWCRLARGVAAMSGLIESPAQWQ